MTSSSNCRRGSEYVFFSTTKKKKEERKKNCNEQISNQLMGDQETKLRTTVLTQAEAVLLAHWSTWLCCFFMFHLNPLSLTRQQPCVLVIYYNLSDFVLQEIRLFLILLGDLLFFFHFIPPTTDRSLVLVTQLTNTFYVIVGMKEESACP